VKTYRPTREVLSSIEALLSGNRPSFHHSPLGDVAELLTSGRHYSWVGIYLTMHKRSSTPLQETGVHPAHMAVLGTVKKIVVSIKIAGRELGFLSVESDRANSFGAGDRVLLERVAGLLARFLTGRGKYLVLKADRLGPAQKAATA
jgi:putative methionine-R-sulfoxide reductase with GAF domain